MRPNDTEFAEFVRPERPKLVHCLLGRGLSPCDAEDVAQTTFLAVSTHWATVNKPRAYLYQAAKHGAAALLRRGDQLGFVDGAYWDIKSAGANGIALALLTGRTVTVCGWEHFVQSQHGLSCVAAPVCDPQGRALFVLKLTGTQPTVHPALRWEIDTLAGRVHRQLRAPSERGTGPRRSAQAGGA